MADALISRHIPALFGGVSQQNPTLRQPSQAEAQDNMYGTVMDGLRKRPPFRHVAKVTDADISTAHVHTINRDTSERYVVVVTDGDLKVYDAETGAEETVNFPTGKAYLSVVGAGEANFTFSLDTIADYTFVVNKSVATATKVTPSTTPPDYASWFTPDIWGVRQLDWYITPGNGPQTGTVNTFSDLPRPTDASPPSEGDYYKVVGFDQNNFGGYWVRYTGGAWQETYGPNANTSMDEATLPHALVRQSDGTFTFAPFAWRARQVGDDETNPPPTFIGRKINGVFYWKNRLGFITDENVVFSGAGDYGNFWRNTMTTLLDSDVVDVAVSTNKVSILQFAVPFNNSMMLFADQTQFSLNVTDVLTPTSVSIDEATSYEMDKAVRPVGVGSEVYFVARTGNYSRVREYFVHNDSIQTDAADITAHVPRYVPRDIIKMTGSSIEDVLFVASKDADEKNRLYCYNFYWSGDEKVQSSWSRWNLGDSDEILSVDMIESQVYVLVKRTDGTYLEVADLDNGSVTASLDFDVLLDRRHQIQPGDMVYDANTDRTTIILPYVITEQEAMKVVLTEGSGVIGKLIPQVDYLFPTPTRISVPGDITSNAPYVGVNYDAVYRFSEQFTYDGQGNADTTGNLMLRTFTITYSDAGFFSTRVYPYGLGFAPNTEDVVPAALDSFTGRQLGEASLTIGEVSFDTGDYRFYVDGKSTDVVIELLNPSHLQSKLLSCQWEGFFVKRSRNY